MFEKIEIRKATIDDLSVLEEVGDQLFDYPIKRNRTIEFLSDSRHHLFLAFDKEKVIGMASGFHYVHPDKDPTLFINEVAVLESFQNRGIGRKLVTFLWQHAKELGCKEAWIGTEKSNMAAQKCYLGAGAKRDEEPFFLFEFEDKNG